MQLDNATILCEEPKVIVYHDVFSKEECDLIINFAAESHVDRSIIDPSVFMKTNVLGTQNVFGYDYAKLPDPNGVYNRQAVVPTADRFFFVGFFWTISDNKNENQLKNL